MTLEAILQKLPATAQEIRQSLGMSHDAVYGALVSLESWSIARISLDYCDTNRSDPRRIWERA